MRFIFQLPVDVARLIARAMERGEYPSADDLAAQAIRQLLATDAKDASARDQNRSAHSSLQSRSRAVGKPTLDLSGEAPWVWGMVNRVFPLKLVSRVCAGLSTDDGISLNAAYKACANEGARLAQILSKDDEAVSRRRNESRAVALPSGDDLEKSKIRFAQQFVGRRDPSRGFAGGAFDLGLLGIHAETSLVALTQLGWEFAALPNQILDEHEVGVSNLTADERDFYLQRIVPVVPAERHAVNAILRALTKQPLTPDELARSVFPRTAVGTSTIVANTARAGALGRLVDVAAVRREPRGRSATLEITEAGRRALQSLEGLVT